MTRDQFVKEMNFIEAQTGRTFPDVAKKQLWSLTKSIPCDIAHQASQQWLYEKSYFSLRDLEAYWNRHAQAVERKTEMVKACERLPERTPENDEKAKEALRKIREMIGGVGSVDSSQQSNYEERREMLRRQAKTLGG